MPELPDDHWEYWEDATFWSAREKLCHDFHGLADDVIRTMPQGPQRSVLEHATSDNFTPVLNGLEQIHEEQGCIAIFIRGIARGSTNTESNPEEMRLQLNDPVVRAMLTSMTTDQQMAVITYAYAHRRDALRYWFARILQGSHNGDLLEVQGRLDAMEELHHAQLRRIIQSKWGNSQKSPFAA